MAATTTIPNTTGRTAISVSPNVVPSEVTRVTAELVVISFHLLPLRRLITLNAAIVTPINVPHNKAAVVNSRTSKLVIVRQNAYQTLNTNPNDLKKHQRSGKGGYEVRKSSRHTIIASNRIIIPSGQP